MKIPNLVANRKKIPILGLGTWQLKKEDCVNTIKTAIKLGYRHIDTAEIYFNENEIGNAVRESKVKREELFIATKVWSMHLTYKKVLKSFQKSIDKLKTNYIDLYLIHWPNRKIEIKETFRAFKELYSEGKIRSIGVSNFTVNHLKDALPVAKDLGIKIITNQVEFHPMLYQKELMEFCHKNKIIITAYSPLARGKILENEIINEIAGKYSKTPAQISLRWIIQKKLIAIPKATSEEHLRENMDIFDFNLNEDDMKKLDSITDQKRMVNPPFISDFDY